MVIENLKSLVSSAFTAGYNAAQVGCGVRTDKIRRKTAEGILFSRGLKAVMLDRWIADGLLKEYKGQSKNSPRWYSLNELNKILTSIELKKII